MNNIYLNIPYVVLSTAINCKEETEERILTPFGIIDVTFRKVLHVGQHPPWLEIEVGGDTEHWLYDDMMAEFRTALHEFIRGIAQRRFENETLNETYDLRIRIRGGVKSNSQQIGNVCLAPEKTDLAALSPEAETAD